MVHKRSREELLQELSDQRAALRASCDGFDAGHEWEACRLATVVYTLLNDGRSKTVSILSQLGLRSSISFHSYATPNTPGNLMTWVPLCITLISAGNLRYIPKLNNGPFGLVNQLKFSDWWKEAVFENTKGNQLSRMNLVFALRSKDGGSHYDNEIPESPYLELKQAGGGWSGAPGSVTNNAHLASMRHIAYELEESLSARA